MEKMSEEAYRRQQIIKKRERKRESLLYYPSLLKALVHCAKGHWNTLVGLTFVIRLVDCQDTRTKVLQAPVTQNLKASIKPQGELLEGRQCALHPCVSPSPGQDRARVSDQRMSAQ